MCFLSHIPFCVNFHEWYIFYDPIFVSLLIFAWTIASAASCYTIVSFFFLCLIYQIYLVTLCKQRFIVSDILTFSVTKCPEVYMYVMHVFFFICSSHLGVYFGSRCGYFPTQNPLITSFNDLLCRPILLTTLRVERIGPYFLCAYASYAP
jgi:hypothetical protein